MYSQNLFGIIFNILKNKEEAEDVLQEVFMKVHQNLTDFDASKGRLFTWLLNISRNAAIDKYRSKDYSQTRDHLPTDSFEQNLETECNAAGRIDAIGLKSVLKALKPKCIKLIDLLFFKGFTQKEASENLEIPLGTVKSRNRNCITALRQQLNYGN
jgi:RNA polymerase sigma-70 factor (ECF subfamily)